MMADFCIGREAWVVHNAVESYMVREDVIRKYEKERSLLSFPL